METLIIDVFKQVGYSCFLLWYA